MQKIISTASQIGEKRSNLLKFVIDDLHYQNCQQSSSSDIFNIFDQDSDGFPHSIEVGVRTGKPDQIKYLNSDKRYRVRVEAFTRLSNYWVGENSKLEIPLRSLSPLRCIFEYQEEYIFDIPQSEVCKETSHNDNSAQTRESLKDSIKIQVSSFEQKKNEDYSQKNLKKEYKLSTSKSRKTCKNKMNIRVRKSTIHGLSCILDDLETQDKSSEYKDSDINVSENFSSALKASSNATYHSSSKRKVSYNSTKTVIDQKSLKPRLRRRVKHRKVSHLSMSCAH